MWLAVTTLSSTELEEQIKGKKRTKGMKGKKEGEVNLPWPLPGKMLSQLHKQHILLLDSY